MPATSSSRELKIIAAALESIREALGRLAPALEGRGRREGVAAAEESPKARRKLRLSPARRSALKLQGQYMGYMRGLKPAQKTRVKAVAARKGIAAAVVVARKLAQG